MVLAGLAMIEIAPFVEQVRTEARAFDRLQELLWNDRVGIDVRAVERRDDPGMNAKRFHPMFRLRICGVAAFYAVM